MKKNKLFLLMFLFASFPLFSQNIYVGLGTGLNFIIGDNYYTANFGRFGVYQSVNGTKTNFAGLGLSSELQFQLNGKYAIINSPFSLTAGFQYYRMRGNESVPIYSDVFQMSIPQNVTSKMDIWAFQFGTNYSFDIYFLKSFVNVSLLSNYFDDVFIKLGDDENYTQFSSYKNGMRYGYSIGVGINYDIFQDVEFELSTHYNSFNVLHKRDGESLLNSTSVLFNIYYKIN